MECGVRGTSGRMGGWGMAEFGLFGWMAREGLCSTWWLWRSLLQALRNEETIHEGMKRGDTPCSLKWTCLCDQETSAYTVHSLSCVGPLVKAEIWRMVAMLERILGHAGRNEGTRW